MEKRTEKNLVNVGLQADSQLYRMFKIAAIKEGRRNWELLNDAIIYYLEKQHPDLLEPKSIREDNHEKVAD